MGGRLQSVSCGRLQQRVIEFGDAIVAIPAAESICLMDPGTPGPSVHYLVTGVEDQEFPARRWWV